MPTIYVRATRQQVRQALYQLPAIVAGKAPDVGGEVRSLQLLAGQVAASLITEAFVVKARGGTDEAGDRWEPLAPSTAKRKGPGAEILRDNDLMLNSLGPGVSVSAAPGEVIVGTNDPKAVWHHRGTRNMPARRLWPDPAKWPGRWWGLIARKVGEGLVRIAARLLGG